MVGGTGNKFGFSIFGLLERHKTIEWDAKLKYVEGTHRRGSTHPKPTLVFKIRGNG